MITKETYVEIAIGELDFCPDGLNEFFDLQPFMQQFDPMTGDVETWAANKLNEAVLCMSSKKPRHSQFHRLTRTEGTYWEVADIIDRIVQRIPWPSSFDSTLDYKFYFAEQICEHCGASDPSTTLEIKEVFAWLEYE